MENLFKLVAVSLPFVVAALCFIEAFIYWGDPDVLVPAIGAIVMGIIAFAFGVFGLLR